MHWYLQWGKLTFKLSYSSGLGFDSDELILNIGCVENGSVKKMLLELNIASNSSE